MFQLWNLSCLHYLSRGSVEQQKEINDKSSLTISKVMMRWETWEFRLWEGKKPGDFKENLEIHAIMDKLINDITLGVQVMVI